MARVGRWIPVFGTLMLVVALLVVPLPQARAATPYRGSIVTWNMSGWTQHKGAIKPADVLASNIKKRSPLPTAIVVNEMCDKQYNELVTQLGYAYQSVPNWSLPYFNQTNCTQFGNAVFYLGTLNPSPDPNVPNPFLKTYDNQANSDFYAEHRNLTCVAFSTVATSTTPSTPLRICGTHLDKTASMATLQLGEAQSAVDGFNGRTTNWSGTPTLLSGDLNLTPGVAAFNDMYTSYSEGDLSGRTKPRATTTSGVKLDYGFVPKARATITSTAKIEPQWFVSDHSIYTTFFSVG